MDIEAINLRLNRGYDGEGPATIFYDLRALLKEVGNLRADRAKLMGHYSTVEIAARAHETMAAEVQRLRAALEKMESALSYQDHVDGAHIEYCDCRVCYARGEARNVLRPPNKGGQPK